MKKTNLEQGIKRGIRFGSKIFLIGFFWVVVIQSHSEIPANVWSFLGVVSATAFALGFFKGIRSGILSTVSTRKQDIIRLVGLIFVFVGCFSIPYRPFVGGSDLYSINSFILFVSSLVLMYFYLRTKWEKDLVQNSVQRWTKDGNPDQRYMDVSCFSIVITYGAILIAAFFLVLSAGYLIAQGVFVFVFFSLMVFVGITMLKKTAREEFSTEKTNRMFWDDPE